jgi:hypothetical protein
MRRKSKSEVRFVPDSANTAEPVSPLSDEEQAYLLDLADVALQTKKPDEKLIAGNRAHQEHELLKQELKDTLDRIQKERSDGRNDAA